jgi:26S proteasome regulatory subunit T3
VENQREPLKSGFKHEEISDMDLKDLYTRVKLLQRRLKFLEIHEEYIKDEVKNLKRELLHAQEEVCVIFFIMLDVVFK